MRTPKGYKVFGDSSTLAINVPSDLTVVDAANRKKETVATVPNGS